MYSFRGFDLIQWFNQIFDFLKKTKLKETHHAALPGLVMKLFTHDWPQFVKAKGNKDETVFFELPDRKRVDPLFARTLYMEIGHRSVV